MDFGVPEDKKLILFDGVCNLCNNSVNYVIKHDKKDVFMFSALQSEVGKKIISHHNLDASKLDSILLFSPNKGIIQKSTAALKIASQLGFPNNVLAIFLIVPSFIRNWVYGYIAKHRYTWYGKKATCMIPTPELKAKFLE